MGILALSFSISFMLRSAPAEYGYTLNEFDPFFNYRATSFIVENGYDAYRNWTDDQSWYPTGRNISGTSQNALHLTAAITYQIFGGSSTLYDFTVIFPVIVGSMTTIVIFALVRVIGGTSAGLLAALFFSVSLPILIRGTMGWFKSEPLGIFYGVLGIYLFVSGIKSDNKKIALLKLAGGGAFISLGLSSWGGNYFFIIILGIFFLAMPFLRDDHKFQLYAIPVFTSSLLLTVLLFDRPGSFFLTSLSGFIIIGPTIFLIVCSIVQMFSKKEKALRNGLILLMITAASGIAILYASFSSTFLSIPTSRYIHAVNPFSTSSNPLLNSVSEHAVTTLSQSFSFHSVFIIFAGIAVWMILQKKNLKNYDAYVFVLIMGLAGVYISSAFVRLEVFASLSLIALSSIGVSMLISTLFKSNMSVKKPTKKSVKKSAEKPIIKLTFLAGIVVLLLVPLNVPVHGNWSNVGKNIIPTILNGGSTYPAISSDWPDTLNWIKTSTPEDSIIAAWWDYGYWITVMGERTSLIDNATLDTKRIINMAQILTGNPDDSWKMLQELDADYILVFVTAEQLAHSDDIILYSLQGGGDESKSSWVIQIAGREPISQYIHPDGISHTDYFWDNTLLGKLFPYTPLVYHDPRLGLQYAEYVPGSIPLNVKEIKYPQNGDGPFRLAYASPSYLDDSRPFSLGVFVYEINKDYTLN